MKGGHVKSVEVDLAGRGLKRDLVPSFPPMMGDMEHQDPSSLPQLPGFGLVAWRASGRVLHVNGAFAALLESPVEALLGSDYWAFTAGAQKQREINLLLAAEGGFEKEYIVGSRSVTARLMGGILQAGDDPVLFAYVQRVDGRSKSEADSVERALRHHNAILLDLAKSEAIDAGDIDVAVEHVTRAGATGLRCARSSVWLYADDETKIVCLDLFEHQTSTHTKGGELLARDFPRYFDALREDRTIAANDAHTHPATREFSKVYLEPLGITSMLEAPIRSHGKLLGVLCSEHVGPMRKFTQEEQNFAANVADLFGRALQAAERHRYELALRESNEQLEATVRARTAALQLTLDSMAEGLLVCELDGTLARERSRAVERWFGEPAAGAKAWDYLVSDGSTLGKNLELAFLQMASDVLPFDVASSQAPAQFERGPHSFAIAYRSIVEDGALARIVIVVSDVTAEVERERSEAAARELTVAVSHIVRDRDAFRSFVSESETLLGRLGDAGQSRSTHLRDLHTLKGNTAIFGFSQVSAACHALETTMLAGDDPAVSPGLAKIVEEWRRALEPIASLLTSAGEVRLTNAEHHELIRMLENLQPSGIRRPDEGTVDSAAVLATVRSWRCERVSSILAPYAAQARRIAERLGKDVKVVLEDGGLRLLDPSHRAFFSALVHCVRNAIDHGVEMPPIRLAAGKPAAGTIWLTTRMSGDALVVSVADDGGGIDWDAVRRKAAAAGGPAETEDDLQRLLFSDGFSTVDRETSLSGRGLGLGAVAHACESLGGTVRVESQRGVGTRFVFTLGSEREHGRERPRVRASCEPRCSSCS